MKLLLTARVVGEQLPRASLFPYGPTARPADSTNLKKFASTIVQNAGAKIRANGRKQSGGSSSQMAGSLNQVSGITSPEMDV